MKINKQKQKINSINQIKQVDRLLLDLRQNKQIKSWKNIASQINLHSPGTLKSGRQCRDRYINHARFGLQGNPANNEWTRQQDELLFQKFIKYGSKWVLISKEMPNKSQNALKNRFYNAIGRIYRKIRRVELKKKIKNKKPITSNRLIRIFHQLSSYLQQQKSKLCFCQVTQHHSHHIHELPHRLIKLSLEIQQHISEEEIYCIIKSIHEFNQLLKPHFLQKKVSVSVNSKIQQNQYYIFQDSISFKKKQSIQHQKFLEEESNECIRQSKIMPFAHNQEERLCFLSQINEGIIQGKPKSLEEELCQIQNREYIPQSFNFFDN